MSGTPRRPPGRPSTRPSLPSEELEVATPSHAPISQAPKSDKPGSLKRPKLGRPPKPTVRDKKKGPFDLSVSDDEQDAPQSDSIDPSLLDSNMPNDAPVEPEPEPVIDDSYDQQNDVAEDSLELKEQDTTIQSIEGADPPLDMPEEDQHEPDATAGATSPPIPERPKNKGGRPPREQSLKPDDQRRPPGRPGKQAQITGPPPATKPQAAKSAQRGPKRKVPFAERDPNIKLKAQKKAPKQISSRADSAPPNSSYLISRSQTPMMDEGAITTRSGRTVYKPLASWRGEKAVFARRESINTLGAIQEIVRTEEMPPPPRPKSKLISRGKRSGRGRSRSVIAEEEEEEEEERPAEWEKEDGIQHATVMAWDMEAQKYDEDYTEEVGMLLSTCPLTPFQTLYVLPADQASTEIAFAANAMPLRDIQSATFQFAKTLTLPFFGSGMVGIPPGGEKRVKNSRKMQMVFFVFYGRVTVNVGTPTTTFSIGKGGQWQVPRGECSHVHVRPFFVIFLVGANELTHNDRQATSTASSMNPRLVRPDSSSPRAANGTARTIWVSLRLRSDVPIHVDRRPLWRLLHTVLMQ